MIVQKDFLNKLKDFGLNSYESKLWIALLSRGVSTAGELSDISNVPRSRAYDVLESLEKQGFAIIKIGKPVKYLGVKPKMIIEKLKNNVKKNAEDRIEDLSKVRETEEFVKLEELYTGGIDPVRREDISASLRGKSNISSHLREVLQNAKKEVVICTSAEDLNSKTRLFQQTFEILKDSNIKIKVALFGDENVLKQVEKKFDMKFKRVDINAKFFIVDRTEILFYLSESCLA